MVSYESMVSGNTKVMKNVFHDSIGLISVALLLVTSGWAAEPVWIPLREIAKSSSIHVGTAVKYDAIVENADYRAMVIREYDLVTPENALKWAALRRNAKTFNFHEADAIVEFAQTNHLLIRGHTLCWNLDKYLPQWMLENKFTPAQARALMETHIKTVMGHYRGKIFCWDVVTEAVANNPKGSPLADGFWMRTIGPEYIELAFRFAHEADPQAELFYNDYDLGEPMGAKSDRIYRLVKALKAKGVPITGVGLQSHYKVTKPPTAEALQANIKRLAALGLKVHITELDVSLINDKDPAGVRQDNLPPLAERLDIQAKIYADVARAALSTPACEAIVTWGFSDLWGLERFMRAAQEKGTEFPQRLPFDMNLKPKPAAFSLANAIRDANVRRNEQRKSLQ